MAAGADRTTSTAFCMNLKYKYPENLGLDYTSTIKQDAACVDMLNDARENHLAIK